MTISDVGLALIKQWEGCRLNAYLDSVGVATIGYGITFYPDRRPVRLGDRITQAQADAFLQEECDRCSEAIRSLVTIDLNQNQWDALISLVYNIGTGAFAASTLLKKLNAGDLQAAAAQFPVWNKGVIDGIKQEIAGLTNRRRAERALFESPAPGGSPARMEAAADACLRATWLELHNDQGQAVLVAWERSEPVEIIALASQNKKLLIDAINQYPNATNLVAAAAGKSIPPGPRIRIAPRQPAAGVAPPPAPAQLLARGSTGKSVELLQQRLQDLGYYRGAIDGIFGSATDAALRSHQADFLGSAAADGLVGPLTWKALWSSPSAGPGPVGAALPEATGNNHLRLINTNTRDSYGLMVLLLQQIKDGRVCGALSVCSGAPGRQRFRTGSESRAGSLEPLPEGRWKLEDVVWCDGRDNYQGRVFASNIGPVSTPISYVGPGTTSRGDIEIHIDWNRDAGAPGTAGCIGINSISDYRTFVGWLRDGDPRDLYVDWGLGTCPSPE